jgi:hypothetical protein
MENQPTYVFGLDTATSIHEIKQRIGVQLQASAYFQNLTLLEILQLFRTFYPKRRDPHELLEMVNLSGKADNQVKELSGVLSGVFFPLDSLPNWMYQIVRWLPLSPMVIAMRNITILQETLVSQWQYIALLLGWLVVFTLITVRFFKFGDE